ncbi:MAG: hypothetical protein HY321_07625 [Armatimonadetes bacterium]|nr:hypothetical protein [Armatimonadota bacterium]
MYSPYDWNEAIRHRSEYIEERLAEGSPVVAVSCREGVLLVTVRGTQRKVFEIYDRLAFSAVGQQADIEAVRLGVIDFAHQEGFTRSPDDVTVGRVVAAISPALKKAFGDQFTAPLVLRALFAEVGRTPDADALYVLHYDGEFRMARGFAVVAGTAHAEERMREPLAAFAADSSGHIESPPTVSEALDAGLRAWALGYLHRRPREDEGDTGTPEEVAACLSEALREGEVEAALLERQTTRESRFRGVPAGQVAEAVRRCR